PRRDRPSPANAPPRRPRPRPSAVRRVAPTRAAPDRRAHPATKGTRTLLQIRDGGVCETRADRAQSNRRTSTKEDGRDPRRAHAPGIPDVAPRSRGTHEQGDRLSALHQPEDRRIPPAQDLPQARREVADATRASSITLKLTLKSLTCNYLRQGDGDDSMHG